MTSKVQSFLRMPQGTEGFHLEEAYRHRRITSELERLFHLWGYLPVQTPVFDFFDVYEPLLGRGDQKRVYRLIDREGDLLMLRSDVTLFLARQMGMLLSDDDLPLRVSYSDTILRHQNAEDISKNEFFQVGAELMGKPGIDGDLEILLMMCEALDTIGSPRYVVHVGSRELFEAVFADVEPSTRAALMHAIEMRDTTAFESAAAAVAPPERRKLWRELFFSIGDAAGFGSLLGRLGNQLDPATRKAADHLKSVLDTATATLGRSDAIRADLSEIGSQPYYTGIVFQAYVDGVDSSVASGGRYDRLLGSFGFDAPSVGFSIMVRKLEQILPDPSRFDPPAPPEQVAAASFGEALAAARRLREQGRSAVL